jgi:hypothetical protein
LRKRRSGARIGGDDGGVSVTWRRFVVIVSLGVALLLGGGVALALAGSGVSTTTTVAFPASDGTTVTGADPAPPGSAPASFPGSEAASGARTVTFSTSDGSTVTGPDPAPPSSGPADGGQVSGQVSGRASTQPCGANQIHVAKRGQVGGILGTTIVSVALRNDASTSCVLSGYPGVILLGAGHQHVSLKVTHGELGPKEPRKVTRIVLGGHQGGAMFAISFVDHPGPASPKDCHAFTYLLSSLPGHRTRSLTHAGRHLQACGGRHGPTVELSPIGKM